MGLWSKEQLRQFIKENKLVTAQVAQNALKELFAETLQEMSEAELGTHLGYENMTFRTNGPLKAETAKARKPSSVSMGSRKLKFLAIVKVSLNRLL